jgi:hypothetical protein
LLVEAGFAEQLHQTDPVVGEYIAVDIAAVDLASLKDKSRFVGFLCTCQLLLKVVSPIEVGFEV